MKAGLKPNAMADALKRNADALKASEAPRHLDVLQEESWAAQNYAGQGTFVVDSDGDVCVIYGAPAKREARAAAIAVLPQLIKAARMLKRAPSGGAEAQRAHAMLLEALEAAEHPPPIPTKPGGAKDMG
ncbi:MAG TPA: hypothetical protein VG943_13895 [Caulobacterales bacterium]|nr:hypothetical protein [Caulobacterales bacterium]